MQVLRDMSHFTLGMLITYTFLVILKVKVPLGFQPHETVDSQLEDKLI